MMNKMIFFSNANIYIGLCVCLFMNLFIDNVSIKFSAGESMRAK